jgi:hypothetical protein
MPTLENFHNGDPARVANRPGYVIGALSGALTVITAGADVFALRNVAAEPLVVSAIRLGWYTTTGFAAAQGLAFGVWKVTGFSVVHDTGSGIKTIAALARRTGAPPLVDGVDIQARMAAAVAISGQTYATPDADEPLGVGIAGGNTSPGLYFNWTPADGLPLVLEADEGVVVRNQITMGATGVGSLHVGIDARR